MTVSFHKLKEEYFVYILFFLFGMSYWRLYVPFILIVFVIVFSDFKLENKKVHFDFLLIASIYILMLVTLLLFNDHGFTLNGKEDRVILQLITVFIVGGFLIQSKSIAINIKTIKFFLLGSFFICSFVVLYSFFLNPVKYGHGCLLNPLTGKEVNSPSYSNLLALSFISFWHSLFYEQNKLIKKILLIILLITTLSMAVFLVGRAFFMLIIISILFFLSLNISLKRIIKIMLCIVIISFIFIHFNTGVEHLAIFHKFKNNGLESKRFDFYWQALHDIPLHPFGMSKVDQSIEHISWFHNIILDTGRVGGLIPMFLSIILLLLPLKALLQRKRHLGKAFIVCMLLATFLLMQQDVIIEGDGQSLSLFLFLSTALLCSLPNSLITSRNKTT